jgi:hypothetical protein
MVMARKAYRDGLSGMKCTAAVRRMAGVKPL